MVYGKLVNYIESGNEIKISFEKQEVVVTVIRDDIINFFVPVYTKEHFSKAIEGDKVLPTVFTTSNEDGKLVIETAKLKVLIGDNYTVDIYKKDGTKLLRDYRGERVKEDVVSAKLIALVEAEGHDASSLKKQPHSIELIKEIDPEDVFFGMGDKSGFLNKRGYEYENWNSDLPQAHNEDFRALYKSIPFYMCKKKDAVYGVFFDNTFKSYMDMGKESSDYLYYAADGGNLDYYFFGGEHLTDIIEAYTYLTGTTPLPQLWTIGYHQCRWGYECAEDIREVAERYRELNIPCESVQYDIDYMVDYKVFTWNEKDYGKEGELFKELAVEGFKPVVIIDPGTKLEKGYFMYEEGMAGDYFAKDKDGQVYVNEVWPGEANYPDFGNPDVRKWWGDHHKFLTDMGVMGVWNDMNEPASFRGELPKDVVFSDEGRKITHDEMHNVYGHLMSKATHEGLKELTGKRPFVITRACYAGSQKYSSVWTGDNQSLWAHLQMLIPQLCNLGISGFSLCGTDIAGFGADTTPELMTRWIEAAAFSTFFRNHCAKGRKRQEPWVFDKATTDIYRKYVELHYTFLPYIYDLLYKGEKNGLPVMRPLVIHYENDANTYNLNDQYMVGDSMIVAPVVNQGQTKRMVYLPEGDWYYYWDGKKYTGGDYYLIDAPIDVLPIFIKGGSIIPTYDVVQYVGQKEFDQVKLIVTPGQGSYEHFIDNGEDYAYREGAYTLYSFKSDNGQLDSEILHDGYRQYKNIKTIKLGE